MVLVADTVLYSSRKNKMPKRLLKLQMAVNLMEKNLKFSLMKSAQLNKKLLRSKLPIKRKSLTTCLFKEFLRILTRTVLKVCSKGLVR